MYKKIMLLLALTQITGCANFPHIYSGDAIHGWVVDAETKQPIKDVVVLEIWELFGNQSFIFDEGDHNGNVHIAETLTDEKGYYVFPKWGPKFTMDGRMNMSAPRLVFYKFGYDDVQLINTVTGNLNRDNSKSEHSGKTIELEKYEGSIEQYPKILDSIYDVLKYGSNRSAFICMWTNVPVFTSEMIKAEQYFRKHHVYSNFPAVNSLSKPGCRDPEMILKGYLR